MPYELARDLCADVGAEESLAVDLVVELHLHLSERERDNIWPTMNESVSTVGKDDAGRS